MKAPGIPTNEQIRLEALASYDVMDTLPEVEFDALTKLAAHVVGTPIALVSLVDADRQWFKSRYGLEAPETPRDVSFCGHVVASEAPLVIPDAWVDERFADNPLVTGEPRVRFYAGIPLRTPDGYVLGTLCAIDHGPRQITAQQQEMLGYLAAQVVSQLELRRKRRVLAAERLALRLSEARQRAIFAGMSEGVVIQDASGAIVQCNPAAEGILGLSFDQMRGVTSIDPRWHCTRPDGAPFPGDEHPAMVSLRSGRPSRDVSMGVLRSAGDRVWISINAEPLFEADQPAPYAVVTTFREVTEVVEAQRALARERNFFETLLENMPGAMVGVFDASLAVQRVFGVDPLLAAGRVGATPISELVSRENGPAVEAAALGCLAGTPARLALRRDGRALEVRFVPFGNAGHAMGLVLAFDVSEREAMRDQIARQERLVMAGTLAAGVGHEINNPLAYMLANVELVSEEIRSMAGASPSARLRTVLETLDEARGGGERIRKIVRGLRAFAREEGELVPTDVASALELASQMSLHDVRQRLTLTLDAVGLPFVVAEEGALAQVFVNLIVHAAQSFATSDVGRNQVHVRAVVDDDGSVVVAVADNGPGVQADVLPRIFDPFYTTRAVSPGVGMGLPLTHNLVTGFGGTLTCESRIGEGTTFRIRLRPASVAVLSSSAAPVAAEGSRRGRVMVIDDEALVARSVVRLLQREHEVVAVSDPVEALVRLQTPGETFDVVFCDLMMPGLTGMDLFRQVQRVNPSLSERFVFVTGGVTLDDARRFLDEVENERLEKPFSAQNVRGIARRYATRAT